MSTETNSAETPVVESNPPESEPKPKKDNDAPAPSDEATDKEAPAVTEDVVTGIEEEEANGKDDEKEEEEDEGKEDEEEKKDETSDEHHKENGKTNGTAPVEAEKNGETEVAKAHKRPAEEDVEILTKKSKSDDTDNSATVTVE
uniref:Uncharacterized protein n=1 Tax=Panagrolaimus sp. ES5 TaxID=591445 RepID=A0AC34FN52_9BILA